MIAEGEAGESQEELQSSPKRSVLGDVVTPSLHCDHLVVPFTPYHRITATEEVKRRRKNEGSKEGGGFGVGT